MESGLVSVVTFVVSKPSKAEVRREISAIKETTRHVTRSQATARDFLRKNGFITPTNRLSAKYR